MKQPAYKDIDSYTLLGLKIIKQAVSDYKCTGSNSCCDDWPLFCDDCKRSCTQFLHNRNSLFEGVLQACKVEMTQDEFLNKVGFEYGQQQNILCRTTVEISRYRHFYTG